MGVGMVVQVGVRILRKHWAALLGTAALLVGPVALLTAATGIHFNTVTKTIFGDLDAGFLDSSAAMSAADLERLGGALGLYLLATTFAGILGTIAAIGFSVVVDADYHGRRIDLGASLRACLRRGLSVLGMVLVTTLIIVAVVIAGLALIIVAMSILSGGAAARGGPGAFVGLLIGVVLVVTVMYLSMRWALAVPVIAIEDRGWRDGLRRSWHLSGDNVWRTLLVILIAALATAVLGAVLSQLLAIILVDLLAASLGLDTTIAETLAIALGTVLVAPLAAVFVAVLYFDLRARRDQPASSRPDRT